MTGKRSQPETMKTSITLEEYEDFGQLGVTAGAFLVDCASSCRKVVIFDDCFIRVWPERFNIRRMERKKVPSDRSAPAPMVWADLEQKIGLKLDVSQKIQSASNAEHHFERDRVSRSEFDIRIHGEPLRLKCDFHY